MSSPGYSGKPLVEKLGYHPGDTVYLVEPPAWFSDYLAEQGVITNAEAPVDWAHVFATSEKQVMDLLARRDLSHITKGMWWSWPKKSSNVVTDLTEQSFRDLILPLGWVDTKVCAVDDTWSGLKFLRRKT